MRRVPRNITLWSSGRRVAYSSVTLLIIVLAVLLSSGSAQQANTTPATQSHEVSGFLGDYAGLFPDQANGDLLLYVKERGILRNYDKFIVDPATVYLPPEAQGRALDPDDLKLMAHDCRQALVDELQGSGRYKMVTDPGPGVLHLRAALTDVEPTRAKANTAVMAERLRHLRL